MIHNLKMPDGTIKAVEVNDEMSNDLYNARLDSYKLIRDQRFPQIHPALSTMINGANVLKVTAGTTGYRGGDSGHGGESFFEIKDEAATDMSVSINGEPFVDASRVVISVGGDSELCTLIQALEFGARALKALNESQSLRTLARDIDESRFANSVND